jgi:methyltransferase (TIGR00027 family)
MSRDNESFAGVGTAATRVIELYTPAEQRLFNDPYALKLLPFSWRVLLRLFYLPGLRNVILSLREQRMPGSLGTILCRTRYIDDTLRRCLADGLDQVVILGAGFDTRAHRIPGMDQIMVYEVDLPGTVALKTSRLESVFGAVPDHVTLIGLDFDHDDLGEALCLAGFQKGLKTLFIWEGVTQYITAYAVDQALEFVVHASGVCSSIVFTYVPRGLIDGSDRPGWMENFLSFAARIGSPFIFGINPAEIKAFLSTRGLTLLDDVGISDYQELYLKPLNRHLEVFDGERTAFAVVSQHVST